MKIRLNSRRLSIIELAFIVFIYAAYILPNFSLGATMLLGLLLLYSAFLFLVDGSMRSWIVKFYVLIAIIALFYMILTDASSIAENASNRTLKRFVSKVYQYTSLYLPALMLIRVQRAANLRQKKILVVTALAMMAYVVVTTWLYLLDHPNATREWASFDENAEEGVANYYFIYAIPAIIAVATACLVTLRPTSKVISAVVILLALEFLTLAQYTLSILIAVFGVAVQIYQSIRTKKWKYMYVLAMIVVVLFLPSILQAAINGIESKQVTIRLREIYDFLTGQGADGYNLNGRWTLYTDTLRAFARSPIWGNRTLKFDGHATFLTVLADTGLLGGIPFYVLYAFICKTVVGCAREHKKQIHTVILMFTLLGLTNPVHASMLLGLASWFLTPLMMTILLDKENKHATV